MVTVVVAVAVAVAVAVVASLRCCKLNPRAQPEP